MKLLGLEDREIFEEYLKRDSHSLSYFSFVNIFIWRNLFEISYLKIRDSLCVFFKDRTGVFMSLPPLGNIEEKTVFETFEIMDRINENESVSRIENVEEKDLGLYKKLRFKFRLKDREYIYLRDDLVSLKGDRFKSKRNSYNYFSRNYKPQYLDYSPDMKEDCLSLYRRWSEDRKKKIFDPIYQEMLDNNFSCFKIALDNYKELNLKGKLLRVDGNLCGVSIGFQLNERTFCILFEITDLRYKGASQFIFREFCKELFPYEYINTMGDSGLENLRSVKLSYQPILEAPEYIITR